MLFFHGKTGKFAQKRVADFHDKFLCYKKSFFIKILLVKIVRGLEQLFLQIFEPSFVGGDI